MLPAPLDGLRIALLETHRLEEAAAHVRRLGGDPYCVPAVREVIHPDRVGALIDRLVSRQLAVVVFMTGPGATVLLDEAARLGRVAETIGALGEAAIVCRGPKPASVLRRHGLPPGIAAAEPYTTRQVLEALDAVDLRGKAVALVQLGEPNSVLVAELSSRGAVPETWAIYESTLPDDLEPLTRMVHEIIDGHVDALALSNRIQCRHLFRIAADRGSSAALTGALNSSVVVAAVGPVCAEALEAFGVSADVIPARPTLESMIGALAEYFELTREEGAE